MNFFFKYLFRGLIQFFVLALFLFEMSAQDNVGIGTTTPNASSILELSATNKGFLVPRLTTLQRNAITTPATGLLIFNTDNGTFEFYSGTTWIQVYSGSFLSLDNGKVFVGNGSNQAAQVNISGDATISNTGALTIASGAVTTSKIANNSVDGEKIQLAGNATGDMMYFNGTDWVVLTPGTNNFVLKSNGAGVAPSWVNPSGLETDPVYTAASSTIVFDGDAAGGDLTGTYPSPTVAAGAITNSKVSATAEIAVTKLGNGTNEQLIRTNGTDVEWWTPNFVTTETDPVYIAASSTIVFDGDAAGGDLTGTYPSPTVAAGAITDSKVSATAEISVTKLGNGTNNQIVRTNGTDVEWWTPSYLTSETDPVYTSASSTIVFDGDVAGGDLSGTYPSPTVASGAITNTKVSATAEIDVSKLANSTTDLQIIRTNGANVEWWTPSYITSETDPVYTAAISSIIYNTTSAGGSLTGSYPNPTIANNAVTTARINNSAVTTAKIASNAVDGTKIQISGNATGDMTYYNGTDWVVLTPGANNTVLKSNGAGVAPSWSATSALESDPVYTAASSTIVFDGDAAGGDLTGTYPNPTVAAGAITDTKVSATAEISVTKLGNGTNNQIIRTSGTDVEWWTPSYITSESDPIYTTASSTIVFDGDAAGGDLTGTYPSPTVAAGAINNSKVSATAEIDVSKLANSTTDLQIIRTNGTDVEWWTPNYLTTETVGSGTTAGGDLSGTYPNPSVDGLQGNSVSNASPTNGQVLTWNNSLSQWEPQSPGSSTGWTLTGNALTGTELLGSSNAQPLVIITNNTERSRFLSSGEFGIGLTAPTAKLHQDGGDATSTSHKFTAGTTTGQTSGDGFDIGIDGSGNAVLNQKEDLNLYLRTADTERMRIWNDGQIGINYTTSFNDSVRMWLSGDMVIDGDLIVTGVIDPIALQLIPQASAPSGLVGKEGYLYYDDNSNTIKITNGTSWSELGSNLTNGLDLKNTDNAAKELKFYEPSTSGTDYTAFKAQAQDNPVTYTLPAADGTDGQFLKTNGSGTLSWATAGGGSSVPSGAMMMWTTNTAPTGWLLCDGSAVSRSTYSDLFAIIGTTYGTGDGSTTFNLPDLRGRMPLGKDDMGGTSANRVLATQADNLGQGNGTETHTLSIDEMPSHTHNLNASSTNGSSNASGNIFGYATVGYSSSSSGNKVLRSSTMDSVGSGLAHNNMPPYITITYIIKY